MRNRGDVRKTIFDRSFSYQKLLWLEQGGELSAGSRSQDSRRHSFNDSRRQAALFSCALSDPNRTGRIIGSSWAWIMRRCGCSQGGHKPAQARPGFPPTPHALPESLLGWCRTRNARLPSRRSPGGNDNYYTEGKKSYMPSFRLGRGKSALANVPADVESFPVSTWFQRLLEEGVQTFALNGLAIRSQPSGRWDDISPGRIEPALGRRQSSQGSIRLSSVVRAREDSSPGRQRHRND